MKTQSITFFGDIMREKLIELVKEWTENSIDITEDFNDWYEVLTERGYIRTYTQMYQIELKYLQSEKDYDYYDSENDKWDIDRFIQNDNDIEQIIDGLYFVHSQDYIDEYTIELCYEEIESNKSVRYAYRNLHKLHDNFHRVKDLLIVLQNDFGSYKHYVNTDIQYAKERMLIAVKDIVDIIDMYNNDTDYSIELFVSDNTKSQYHDLVKNLIKYSDGYDILKNSDEILECDAILFKTEQGNHILQYYTYDNINRLCNYIEEEFSNFIKFVLYLYSRKEIQEINKELGKAINNCWDRIDFEYNQFYEDYTI